MAARNRDCLLGMGVSCLKLRLVDSVIYSLLLGLVVKISRVRVRWYGWNLVARYSELVAIRNLVTMSGVGCWECGFVARRYGCYGCGFVVSGYMVLSTVWF